MKAENISRVSYTAGNVCPECQFEGQHQADCTTIGAQRQRLLEELGRKTRLSSDHRLKEIVRELQRLN